VADMGVNKHPSSISVRRAPEHYSGVLRRRCLRREYRWYTTHRVHLYSLARFESCKRHHFLLNQDLLPVSTGGTSGEAFLVRSHVPSQISALPILLPLATTQAAAACRKRAIGRSLGLWCASIMPAPLLPMGSHVAIDVQENNNIHVCGFGVAGRLWGVSWGKLCDRNLR
jgi:hypothetical protein